MKEYHWHTRQPTTEHHQWFQNLMDLHQLTRAWSIDLDEKRTSAVYHIKRVADLDIQNNQTILDKFSTNPIYGKLEFLLNDKYPEEFLPQMEHMVWAVQAWNLRSILERISSEERGALMNTLEHSSWKAGRECSLKRWPQIPDTVKNDLCAVFAALLDSPLLGKTQRRMFLIKRAIASELEIELLACPHQTPYPETVPIMDELCALHTHWMRGFVYALNTQLVVDYKLRNHHPSRCLQHWKFHRDY